MLGRSEITARDCARRQPLPNHTNQRPHCVDYLVNLLMPLSSIAGVNVPGPPHTHTPRPLLHPTPTIPLLGRCSVVGLVICFKRFLGNESRQEGGRGGGGRSSSRWRSSPIPRHVKEVYLCLCVCAWGWGVRGHSGNKDRPTASLTSPRHLLKYTMA